MKNKILILFLSLIILQSCNSSVFAQKTDNVYSGYLDSVLNRTAKISLKINGNFVLAKQQVSGNSTKLEFKSNTDFLVVKTSTLIEDTSAVKIIQDKRFLIDNLYKTQPSPYPDVVSNSINCPDKFRPLPFDSAGPSKLLFAYKIFANDRFVFGECTDDAVFYTAAYIFIYCRKNKILNEIKYFTPKQSPVNRPEDVISNIICSD